MKKKLFLGLALIGMLLTACGDNSKSTEPLPESKNNPVSSVISSEAANSDSSVAPISAAPFSSESSSSSENRQRVDINIINESTSNCTITPQDRSGYVGDDATFTITMKEGYTKTSVSASNSFGQNVALIEDGNTYTYVIQSDGYLYVEVRAEKPVSKQKLYVIDTKGYLSQAPAYVTKTGVETITDIVYGEGDPYYNVITNSTVRFYFQNKVNFETLGLTYKNRNYTPDINNTVTIDFSGQTGDLRVEVYGKRLGSPLVAVNSEHLTISFMNKSKTQVIDAVVTDTDYYVIITSEDKNVYLLDTLTLSYCSKGSTNPNTTDLTDYAEETATGWQLLRRSSSLATDENGFVWTVTEDNLNKYINEPFCGDYVAFTTFTYTYTDYNDLTLAKLSLAGSGKTTYKNRTLKVRDFEVDENNVYTLKNKDQYYTEYMIYQDDCLIAGYNGSNDTFGTPFYTSATDSLSDDVYAIKMLPNTSVSDYSVEAQAFTIDGVTQVLSVIKYQNNFYKAMYTQRDKERHVKNFFMNVTIDVMYGNSWKDAQAIFSVKKGSTVISTIGFSGDGGNRNKTFVPNYGGLYQNGNDQLVVCENVSVYKGVKYVSSIAENQTTLTLKNSNSTYVIELNNASRTFSVTSSDVKTMAKGPFAGKKYRVNHTSGFDINNGEGNYGYYMEFDSDNATLCCVADIYWNMTMTSTSQYYFGKTWDADYYYDADTGKITAMILGVNNDYVIAEFTFINNEIHLNVHELTLDTSKFVNKEIILTEVEA